MNIYEQLFKPLLFQIDAEQAHHISAGLLKYAEAIPGGNAIIKALFSVDRSKTQSCEIGGIVFPNRVGLAAGFDKNAELVGAMALLGFGFVEIGTVTPKPQIGNPKPRLFRVPNDEAIVNRMGFNNEGMKVVATRLSKRKNRQMIVGGNIGKNKSTPNESASADYLLCFRQLTEHVDYFTINLSSPNTPGLRQLLEKDFLNGVLEPVQNENQKQKRPQPIFLKIAPDLADGQLEEIVEVCLKMQLTGIVATNTTVSREGLSVSENEIQIIGQGGLSGKPISQKSTLVLEHLKLVSQNKLSIMSSGGIMNSTDAKVRFEKGADAIQLYSGLIYSGPGLVKSILKSL